MMQVKLLLEYSDFLLLSLSVVALVILINKNLWKSFSALSLYLLSVCLLEALEIPILFFRRSIGIDVAHAYYLLFYGTWAISLVQTGLMIAVIYGIFEISMKPLTGLHRIGTVVFRWVTVVSAILALAIMFGPHIFASGDASTVAVTTVLERFQEGVSVLTLCLLLFVCFTIKPLGLSYRSHIFGVTMGLGVISAVQLVQAAWYTTSQAHSLYSPVYLVSTLAYVLAIGTWGVYFALPEPSRKLILLPTTSPFFHWNRIAEALGDAPGNVAIGFNASMISPIETKMMTAMSKSNREREAAAKAEVEAQVDSFIAS
jgi:hypothetical protein